jgi:hypothetical protein
MQLHLTKPIEISVNGKIESSEFLNIEEPNRGNLKDVAELQEIALAALLNVQKNAQAPDTKEQTGEASAFDEKQALMILKMGGKYKEAIEAFDAFLAKYAKFDDMQAKSGTLARLDVVDYNKALGGYFSNFCFSEFFQI